MLVSLSLIERVILLSILPAEGNITTIRVIQKLKENVGFDEEELIKYNIKFNENRITWNSEYTNVSKDVEFGQIGIDMIVKALKTLDESGKVTEQHLSLFDKFIEKED